MLSFLKVFIIFFCVFCFNSILVINIVALMFKDKNKNNKIKVLLLFILVI